MKKRNLRYEIMDKYVTLLLNDNLDKVNKFFKANDKLLDAKKITLAENDALVDSITAYGDYIIELLSKCPYINIEITNKNDTGYMV